MGDLGGFRPDVPRYVQVADAIRARIVSGEIPPRMPVPSEYQLQQEFGVARATARKAIAALRDAGYIVTVRGLGSFVRDRENWP